MSAHTYMSAHTADPALETVGKTVQRFLKDSAPVQSLRRQVPVWLFLCVCYDSELIPNMLVETHFGF